MQALIEDLDHPAETRKCIGQEQLEHRFEKAHQAEKMPHSWLFLGPQGVGKRTLAYQMIRFLAAGAGSFEALGKLNVQLPIFQKIVAGTYDDLWVLEPEARGKSPPVEAVRSLHTFLQHTSLNGRWRIVLIDGVDWLSHNASNALLKAVEDPPSGVIFFLLAERVGGVLTTLRSRCQMLKLSPLSKDQLAREVTSRNIVLPQETFDIIWTFSRGCLGRALFLIHADRWKKVLQFFEILNRGSLCPNHRDFAPPIRPEILAFLGEEDISFWEPFLFDWLYQRTLEAVEKGNPPPPTDIFGIIREASQFNLDQRHFWTRLLELFNSKASNKFQAA